MFRQTMFVSVPALDPDSTLTPSSAAALASVIVLLLAVMFRCPVPARAWATMPLAASAAPLIVLLFKLTLIVPLLSWITRMPLAFWGPPARDVIVLPWTVALIVEVSKFWMLITFSPLMPVVPVLRFVKPD